MNLQNKFQVPICIDFDYEDLWQMFRMKTNYSDDFTINWC